MYSFEKLTTRLRHITWLEQANWLWDRVRPHYNKLIYKLGKRGLKRIINGTDSILILSQFRGFPETYEPEVWCHLMSNVQPSDIVADVGAYIGLYSITLAKRLGPAGKVFAFEPDPANFEVLKQHVQLNHVQERVELLPFVVGQENGALSFKTGGQSQSSINTNAEENNKTVKSVCLDSIFNHKRLDILKIDVEGYEEFVLRGAEKLLQDTKRKPRLIYIEIHCYAWPELGTNWDSLLKVLFQSGYQASQLNGKSVEAIDYWGEIIAYGRSE